MSERPPIEAIRERLERPEDFYYGSVRDIHDLRALLDYVEELERHLLGLEALQVPEEGSEP